MKGPCGSDGGRRRYDAASPEPMYRVETYGFAAGLSTQRAHYNPARSIALGEFAFRGYTTEGSVSTFTSAGLPDAKARSSAGRSSSGRSTSSPWPPSASHDLVIAAARLQVGRHGVAVQELHRVLLERPDAVVPHHADDGHAVADEGVELHPREAERAVAEQQAHLPVRMRELRRERRAGPAPRQPYGPGSIQQPGS